MDSTHAEIGQTIIRTGELNDNTINSLRLALDDFNKGWAPPA
jgi:hypothetical protein